MLRPSDSLDFTTLRARYRAGTLDPIALIDALIERIAARGDDKVWIERVPARKLRAMAEALVQDGPAHKPLYGIPFAIKDNIDLAGLPTTAACPGFAYRPKRSAAVVARLIAAGAIPLGKTNLDQFATGLNGTRSPYGAPGSVFDPAYISGGSSSGSAVAVAAGLASFALGTDTAGSGRIPAAFNNIVGLKPTRGLLSATGVVPACRSLDCVSIFALTASDAADVLMIAKGFDEVDPFARHEPKQIAPTPHAVRGCRFGVPHAKQLKYFGNKAGALLFQAQLDQILKLGGKIVEIDYAPFLETARLLYEGPWVAERYAAIRDFIEKNPKALHPVTRKIIQGGAKPRAIDAFAGYYRLKALRQAIAPVWDGIDVLITPTAGRTYTIDALRADPFRLNSDLGYYTNFMNLLDLSAVAVPAGFQPDGLPFGITLAGPAFAEAALLALGGVLHAAQGLTLGGTDAPMPRGADAPAAALPKLVNGTVQVAVCGAHMLGLPLNHQLTERGGRMVRRCRTAPRYRLYALPGGPPARPGMVRVEHGEAIEVEVWELPVEGFGGFVDGIPAPLGIGTIELEDGRGVRGFICESYAVGDARDITELGGWRNYLSAQAQQQ